jgi:N-acetylglutamate synthase-like GNAT family acetyltransferase
MRPGETLEGRIARMTSYLGHRQLPTVIVALEDEQPIGSAMLIVKDLDSHTHLSPWLAGVYVRPEYRRRGIATTLVLRIVEEARALRFETLYLFTEHSEHLYARLGWSVIERTVFSSAEVTVMALQIQP